MSAQLQKIERKIYTDYIKSRVFEKSYAENCLFTRIYPNEYFCGDLNTMKDKIIPQGLSKIQINKHAIVENGPQICLSILGIMYLKDQKFNFTHQIVGNRRDPIEVTMDSLTLFELADYEKPLVEFSYPQKSEAPKSEHLKNGPKDNKQKNDRRNDKPRNFDAYQGRQSQPSDGKFKPYVPNS